jgi:transcriptional regulator GlxA family with amidase domain
MVKTPTGFIEQGRVASARRMLEETKADLERVASRCGFGRGNFMRRLFLHSLGVTPASSGNASAGREVVTRPPTL